MNKGIYPGFTQRVPKILPYPRYNANLWPAKHSWLGRLGADVRMLRATVGSSAIRDTAFNGQLGVAVDTSGLSFRSSDDGLTWVAGGALPTGTGWSSVIFSQVSGLFVAINSDNVNAGCATSPTGAVWTSRATLTAGQWQKVAINTDSGVLFTVNRNSATAGSSSADGGLTWTARTLQNTGGNHLACDYGNGLYVAYAGVANSLTAQTSPDLVTWTIRLASGVINIGSVIFGNAYGRSGFFVYSRDDTPTVQMTNLTSPDGLTWAGSSLHISSNVQPAVAFGNQVTYANGMYLLANSDGVYSSLDTSEWHGPARSGFPGTSSSPCNVSASQDKVFLAYGVTAVVIPYTDPLAQDLLYVP